MFFHALSAEWLKTRRSTASWLCITGGFFLPLLFLIGFLLRHLAPGDEPGGWLKLSARLWQFMGMFLLPFGIVLAASLITQSEFRSNAWKQLHATPLRYETIFFSKLTVIVMMTLKFFVFFNLGMLLAGTVPSLLRGHWPSGSFPLRELALINLKFFTACLPVLSFQYLLGLMFRNFLLPIGTGLLLVVGSLILIEGWKYGWLSPYSLLPLTVSRTSTVSFGINIYALSAAYTVGIAGLAFVLYRFKPVKG